MTTKLISNTPKKLKRNMNHREVGQLTVFHPSKGFEKSRVTQGHVSSLGLVMFQYWS